MTPEIVGVEMTGRRALLDMTLALLLAGGQNKFGGAPKLLKE